MKDRGFLTEPERHIGKKVLIFGLIALLVLVLGVYLATTIWYYIQIKQGKKIIIENSSRFTPAGSASVVNSFDRNFLEGGSHPYLGKKDNAEITIVEFVDYNCPNCRSIYRDIDNVSYIYRDRVKIIFRHFPATTISGHEDSNYLSEIAYCGWKQSRFAKVHDFLFSKYDELPHPVTEENLEYIASETGMILSVLKNCLADPKTKQEVNNDYFDGIEAGVRGTPTFFINGQKVEGAIPFEIWKKYLEGATP